MTIGYITNAGNLTNTMPTTWMANNNDTTTMYQGQWYHWVGTEAGTTTLNNYWPQDVENWGQAEHRVHRQGETPEQKARREVLQSRLHEQERERARKNKKIREAAEELLLENLTDEQKHALKHTKCFHVIGSDGERYEIDTRKKWHNVYRLNPGGEREEEYCIYQTKDTPIEDNHLMQKLIVQADTKLLERVANKRRLLA